MAKKILNFPKKPTFLNVIIWLRIIAFVSTITIVSKLFADLNFSTIYTIVMMVIALIAVFGLIELKKWGLWVYVAVEAIGIIRILSDVLFTGALSNQFTKIPQELHGFFTIVMITFVVVIIFWSLAQIIYLIKIRKIFN